MPVVSFRAMKSVPLRVEGMHCAACVGRVEKVLRRVPGVEDAQVSYATSQASVRCADGVDPEALVGAVARAGYGARVPQAERWAEQDRDAAAALRANLRDAALSLGVGALALAAMGPVPHAWMAAWSRAVLLLSLGVMAGPGRGFFVRTARNVPRGVFDMDTLVALGTGAAWIHAARALLWQGAHHAPSLDAVPLVIGMVRLGQALEVRARRDAGRALRALLDLAPPRALRVQADGTGETVALAELRVGDRVRVAAGARVPADGTVRSGAGSVDESMLRGEPMPVPKAPGDRVHAGTVNGPGVLDVDVEAVGEDSALGRIVALVDRAQATRPPVAALADRVASGFVPGVMALAAAAGVGWTLLGHDPSRGLDAALATLVVACPCALGLATPLSLVVGLGNAARAGVLPRDGAALQALAEVDTVVFDKTGTLTVGRPVLVASSGDPDAVRLAAAADRHTQHPLARALVAAAPLDLPDAEDVRVVPGCGVEARVEGRSVRVGSARWLGEGPPLPAEPGGAAHGTRLVVAVDGTPVATLLVRDVVREDAAAAVAALRARGLRVAMLSGDSRAEAERVGAGLGIDTVHAEVLPDGKLAVLRALAAEGRRVAMVGDGVNDAPALAAAHVGLAMGTGTDAAMEAAAITLRNAQPGTVAVAIDIARATLRNVRQNLVFAFAYNAVMLPVAMSGRLPAALAGTAMALSSVSVVLNAGRLRGRSRRSVAPGGVAGAV
ncbi:MAG: hypothetical protein RLZZ299_1922 [Pseudomonadota bacterium]